MVAETSWRGAAHVVLLLRDHLVAAVVVAVSYHPFFSLYLSRVTLLTLTSNTTVLSSMPYRGSGGGGSGSGYKGSGSGGGGGGGGVTYQSGTLHLEDGRINAESLYGYVPPEGDDDEKPVTNASGLVTTQKKKQPVMPMGIRRIEYVEEVVKLASGATKQAEGKKGIAATAEGEQKQERDAPSSSQSSDLFVEQGKDAPKGIKDDGTVWEHAAPKTRIKNEGGEDGVRMSLDDIQEAPANMKTPDSPELTKSKPIVQEANPEETKEPELEPEVAALNDDFAQLGSMLSLGADQEGEGGQAAASKALEGHMFLFQFPPVLPPLKSIPHGGSSTDDVFGEQQNDDDDDDVVMMDNPNGTKIKREDGEDQKAADDDEADAMKNGGFVGQLVVRRSGKVELNWGGQTLELMPGTMSNFLSTAVLLEDAEDVKPVPGQVSGTAFGMGKIQGSFAVAPTWQDEDEWEVDPEELRE